MLEQRTDRTADVGVGRVEEVTVGDVLRQAALRNPDGVALVEPPTGQHPRREWTYAQLLAESERLARALLESADTLDRIAIWANNVPRWIIVQLATGLAGMTLVTVNPASTADEAEHALATSGAVLVFHVDSYRGTSIVECLEQIQPRLTRLRESVSLNDWTHFVAHGTRRDLPQVSPSDLAQIQFTSGTTGRPKGVCLTHRGITNSARMIFDEIPKIHGRPVVNPMPLFHTAGSVVMTLGALQSNCTHVLPHTFDPAGHLALVESEGSALLGGVPTMLRAMLYHDSFTRTDLSSVDYVFTGGAYVEPAFGVELERRTGVPLIIMYGQTECSPGITMTRPADGPDVRSTTVGTPLPGVEVQVAVTDSGISRTGAIGEVGELRTRGYHIMTGYDGEPERTAETIDNDGWLRTGDLATMDRSGNVTIVGRLKDIIIRGGENIFPAEIESALVDHAGVGEAAVVGMADDYWGEVPVAFVGSTPGSPRDGAVLEELLAPYLSRHKIPRRWIFVDEFPLNSTGKILKTALRARLDDLS